MSFPEKITEMEKKLRESGKTVEDLRLEAGIARSTWQRWKSGQTMPNFNTFTKVESAFAVVCNAGQDAA